MNPERSIGVNVGLLFTASTAGLLLLTLLGYAPGWLTPAGGPVVASPVPPPEVEVESAFEAIDLAATRSGPAGGEPLPREQGSDLARIRALRSSADVAGLAAIVTAAPDDAAEISAEEAQRHLRARVTAAHALARVGGERASGVLRRVLEDHRENMALRLAAVSALARTGAEGDEAYLEQRLTLEPSRSIREKIRLALPAGEERG